MCWPELLGWMGKKPSMVVLEIPMEN